MAPGELCTTPGSSCPSKLTSAAAAQFELAQPPNDAISALVFAPESPSRLLVSSWDKNVYLYDTQASDAAEGQHGSLIRTIEHRAPVLDVCFGADDNEAFSAGMDRQVLKLDLTSGEQTVLSKHAAPVRRVGYSRKHGEYAPQHPITSPPEFPEPTVVVVYSNLA